MDTTNNTNKSIKSTIKVTNGCGEYQLPDWGDKVKFLEAEEDEKTGGHPKYFDLNSTHIFRSYSYKTEYYLILQATDYGFFITEYSNF